MQFSAGQPQASPGSCEPTGWLVTRKAPGETTVADKRRRVFADLLRRRFTANRANDTYVGDITYLPIADGSNMYLATVIDCYSRRLVGFAITDHMRTELVQEALVMAKNQRGSLAGAAPDHGSVYTSGAFQDTCRRLGLRQSMGAIGTSADNALAESFNAALKREVLQTRRPSPTSWCAVGTCSGGVSATTPSVGIRGAGISHHRRLSRSRPVSSDSYLDYIPVSTIRGSGPF